MLEKLSNRLDEIYADKELVLKSARALKAVLLIHMAACLPLLVIALLPLLSDQPVYPQLFFSTFWLFALSLISLWILFQGHLTIAAWVFVGGLSLVVPQFGANSAVMAVPIMLIMLSAWFMRRQELLILTFLQLAIVAAVGIHMAQLFPPAMGNTVAGLILIMVAGAAAYALSKSSYSH